MLTAAVPKIATATEVIRDAGAFRALRGRWNELLQASDSDCIFLTWEWLFTWWKHLAEDRSLAIVAVRSGKELIAIAPFCVRPRSLSQGRPLPVLEFLGSGNVGSDYLDVIVRRGWDSEAREALESHLSKKRVWLKLANVKSYTSAAARVLPPQVEIVTNACPFIPLEQESWDSYLASLSAQHRYNFHRKWKRLTRDFTVTFEQTCTEEECREAIDILIEQHNARWTERSDAFHTLGLVAFHGEWTQLAFKRGWLRLYTLRVNGKPAAHLYGMFHSGRFYFYQSSLDAAYMQWSPGLIAMGLAIKSAIEEGAEEFDLLHGTESYKSHWSRASRELVRLESFPPGAIGTLCRISINLARRIKAKRQIA
jgi:CelD/BcsL family acetyltransferase involved in cellulose biosynthesis